jgi:D-hydroxyproline dehydrogenase subunit beta
VTLHRDPRLHPAHNARRAPCVAIVGAGIVGLAHPWAAASRGWRVLLFERSPRACGASIRNFGMVWPIGQPNGPAHRCALKSRKLWLELLRETRAWSTSCGSLHLAYRDDELAVLEEFARIAPSLGFDCELLSAEGVVRRSAAARVDNLLGGLWSETELTIDPREIVARMPEWLHQTFGVELRFNTSIESVASRRVRSSDGSQWAVDRVIVATGTDFHAIYPGLYADADIRQCKLQMMRTVAQPGGWKLGPMLAGGLTLRHYASFGVCHSLEALKRRIAAETPELDRYGIHVMTSQNGRGEVVLGDSHEYGDDISPFDKACIDELILHEMRRMLVLPDWTIQERWHGVYAKTTGAFPFFAEPEPNIQVHVAPGGAGMTMSFGVAETQWESWASRRRSGNHGAVRGLLSRRKITTANHSPPSRKCDRASTRINQMRPKYIPCVQLSSIGRAPSLTTAAERPS